MGQFSGADKNNILVWIACSRYVHKHTLSSNYWKILFHRYFLSCFTSTSCLVSSSYKTPRLLSAHHLLSFLFSLYSSSCVSCMAVSQEKVSFMSPLKEQLEGDDIGNYDNSSMETGHGCCFGWCRGKDGRDLLHDNEDDYEESWWIERTRKVKEASELLAGHKWKNFIRKIGRYCNIKRNNHKTQFQYDPESYALNFDRGLDRDDVGLVRL
ncbi:hypothetical protein Ddye_021854 [Dipteronia dyeriana]|uniref:Stress induced protein n=1 Tax=Dipteronia dyeriana TaxID=168575 RepID=A0AAD9U2H0_9ROSI|nr:hypothetical protein Ddye_021854 [Dipteronia dyeriana]